MLIVSLFCYFLNINVVYIHFLSIEFFYWRTIVNKKKLNKKNRVKYPFSVKLIGIISLIVIFSVAVTTILSSYFFMQDSVARVEENNLTLVQVFSSQMEAELKSVYSSALSILDILRLNKSDTFYEITRQNYFDRNPRIAYIGVPSAFEIYNHKFFLAHETEQENIQTFLTAKADELAVANAGEIMAINATSFFGVPVIAIAAPYTDLGSKNRIVILFSTENLQTMCESGDAFATYAISKTKELLVHPDFNVLKTDSFDRRASFLKKIDETSQDLFQFEHKDEDGINYFIASQKVSFANFTVISKVPVALVYVPVKKIAVQNVILACIVLGVAILIVWFFAHTVSRPILALTEASELIENGQFNIDLKQKSSDEIGLLTKSFVQMSKGLAERERLRDTFGKFVNKEIAARAASGDLKLGGERKNATIFFSDIRSFTAISENMSPEGVVEFLNAYMTRMVTCIEKTHGVVDKFIGDAIMGVWGAPISTGSSELDADFAIRAMLLMRKSLIEFNQGRGTPDKPILKIGCGLNTGPCLAGQIGSLQRMEYTVIGDTVNTASRIEVLNKPFCTDILISENTYNLVKNNVIVEPMRPIKVKGKTEPLQIYALINYKNAPGPQTLDEVRKLLHITPPVTTVDPDKEEVKYEIL